MPASTLERGGSWTRMECGPGHGNGWSSSHRILQRWAVSNTSPVPSTWGTTGAPSTTMVCPNCAGPAATLDIWPRPAQRSSAASAEGNTPRRNALTHAPATCVGFRDTYTETAPIPTPTRRGGRPTPPPTAPPGAQHRTEQADPPPPSPPPSPSPPSDSSTPPLFIITDPDPVSDPDPVPAPSTEPPTDIHPLSPFPGAVSSPTTQPDLPDSQTDLPTPLQPTPTTANPPGTTRPDSDSTDMTSPVYLAIRTSTPARPVNVREPALVGIIPSHDLPPHSQSLYNEDSPLTDWNMVVLKRKRQPTTATSEDDSTPTSDSPSPPKPPPKPPGPPPPPSPPLPPRPRPVPKSRHQPPTAVSEPTQDQTGRPRPTQGPSVPAESPPPGRRWGDDEAVSNQGEVPDPEYAQEAIRNLQIIATGIAGPVKPSQSP
ncbi:vegetative cell wall protein gp1-like isoform X2 [Hypomesus transpacificus]|nr:vegetative cell wall protein gp1-like isoform X2 [Hypomesus transpacificus]